MPQKPSSLHELQEALNAFAKHGTKTAAADALDLPLGTLQHRVERALRAKLVPSGTSSLAPLQRIKQLESELRTAQKVSADLETIKKIVGTASLKASQYVAPEWTKWPETKRGSPGVPTLLLSDFHWGEKVIASQIGGVNTFSLEIARERLAFTIENAISLCKTLDPEMRYPGIVVPLGGDMISGNIHEELQATNELNTMPTALDLYGHLVSAICRLADTFGGVFLPCVSGNHGRDTRKTWAKDRNHTSFDWLLYQFLAKRFESDKRVTFFIPDGSDAYYRVYEHRYLLTHGDQFRGGDGMIGALGPIIRGDHKKRSRNAQIDMEYDTLLCGHWHQYMQLARLIVNGSLKGYDEYAYQGNFGFEPPTQALWITHPKYRITWRMPVYCDAIGKVKAVEWVSVPRS